MKVNFFKAFDYFIFFSVLILVTIGIFFIYSSGINSEGLNVSNEFIKQIIWVCIGIVLMVFMTFVDYRRLNRFAPFLYLFLVLISSFYSYSYYSTPFSILFPQFFQILQQHLIR